MSDHTAVDYDHRQVFVLFLVMAGLAAPTRFGERS